MRLLVPEHACQLCSVLLQLKSAADSILTERKLTRMKFNSILRSITLARGGCAGSTPPRKTDQQSTINIAQSAKIGKADLQAGEYRLLIDGNKATVQKGSQVVAESEGRWEDRASKSLE